jgi:hypothetical protein
VPLLKKSMRKTGIFKKETRRGILITNARNHTATKQEFSRVTGKSIFAKKLFEFN